MQYDILSTYSKKQTLVVEAGKITALRNSEIQKHSARRFENERVYQASRAGTATRDQLINDTKEWGGPGLPHSYGFAPPYKENRTGNKVDQQKVLQDYQDGIQWLGAKFPEFIFSGKLTIESETYRYESDYGLDLETSGDRCGWHILYQRRGSGNMFDGYLQSDSTTTDISKLLAEHSEFLSAQKKQAKLTLGRMPVVLFDGTSHYSPLGKLVESFLINRYKENSCLFANRLGEKLFSSNVTIYDESYDPANGFNLFFDGDGVVRKNSKHTLVDKGVFSNLICDLRFSHKYNHPSTGNGLRTYNTGVTLKPHSLRYSAGARSWRDVLKSLDRCLVVNVYGGGDSNGLGDFSSPAQVAYVYEKGEIQGLAPQVSIKTNVRRFLMDDFISIASDGEHSESYELAVIAEMEVF